MQCQKSRRQCPGYKDDFDLVFRNETKATERRARRTLNIKKINSQIPFQAGEPTLSCSVDDEGIAQGSQEAVASGSQLSSRGLLPMDVLSVDVDEQAPCFFVSSYVMKTDHASKGYFDFLLPLMKTEAPDSHLALAFSAVAMASLANRPNAKRASLFNQAIYRYSKALKATNLALQDPAHQKSDQTLASVLMLGFYEV
jgi:hypothetical protein